MNEFVLTSALLSTYSNRTSPSRCRCAEMNILDFVFSPHKYLAIDVVSTLPFSVPATASALAPTPADIETFTTLAAAIPTGTIAPVDAGPTYNTSTLSGFLFYLTAQWNRIFTSASTGGMLFGGPTRNYWMLTLFIVSVILNVQILMHSTP